MEKINYLKGFVIFISDNSEFSDNEFIKSSELNIVKTGVGKVNATMFSSISLYNSKNVMGVINLGSCGSRDFPIGSLVNPNIFINKDMDATGFGYKKYQTPKEDLIPIPSNSVDLPISHPVCVTSDTFCDLSKSDDIDVSEYVVNGCGVVYDMEGYALAKVCATLKIPFFSIKYVTDNCSSSEQSDNESSCTKSFKNFLFEFNNLLNHTFNGEVRKDL